MFNEKDKNSIESYAKRLLGKNLTIVLGEDLQHRFNKKQSKGRLGQVIEEAYFGYKVNSKKEADFKEAGIELKVAPLKRIKPKEKSDLLREQEGLSAKERIVLSIIDFMKLHKEEWDNNSLFEKCKEMLLMFYIHEKDKAIEELDFRLIDLWSPSEEDLLVIKKDWEIINYKVKQGKAHEISEGDTMYLGACTKGSTAEKSKREQPFNDILAPQRAFSLKRSYVDSIIEELLNREKYSGNISKSISNLDNTTTFDDKIMDIFNSLKGFTLKEIVERYNVKRARKAKNYNRLVIDDICTSTFGDKLENLQEFKKANIEIKTILLKENGTPKESMSFEQINFKEIIQEEWEDSKIRDKFENKKHLWIVFKAITKFDKQFDLALDEIILEKVMFWNMPISDLEGSMKKVWEHTVNQIKVGEYNKFIRLADKEISHIRPKGKDSNDVMITPQETFERRKCFWLNASYIQSQIEKEDN